LTPRRRRSLSQSLGADKDFGPLAPRYGLANPVVAGRWGVNRRLGVVRRPHFGARSQGLVRAPTRSRGRRR